MSDVQEMFDIQKEVLEWGGRTLVLETGRIARLADGAVLATYGQTTVLATVVSEKTPLLGVDFLPLTVTYQEKAFSVGKIPGGYIKREGRPSENEILTSRLIDRPIRPLFAKGYAHDTQVIATVLEHDLENNPDIVALIASSAALTLSGVPFMGPVGAARVGYRGGQFLLNPTLEQMEESSLDLVVAGTQDAVLMVESEAQELSEEVMLQAVLFGQKGFQPIVEAIVRLAEKAAKPPRVHSVPDYTPVLARMRALTETELKAAYADPAKASRREAIQKLKERVCAAVVAEWDENAEEGVASVATPVTADVVSEQFKFLEADLVRTQILEEKRRIDGRDLTTVRPIRSEVGLLPRTHGSALFTRGETQALVVVTLGTGEDEQMVDLLTGMHRESFLLHYNFPPYSVGETGRFGSPGRREVGHGKLAWRALHPVLPAPHHFPYTLRVVSEITASNGSSSMATVCGASLALMDAGVPLKAPVAGVAMGLIKEGDRFAVLSDILGDEDHLGDMDFKVAGTAEGVTSLQMDIKITGINEEIMRVALGQAQQARLHILSEMSKALGAARAELGAHAPRIETMTIPTSKIREVIGTGGKVIREIVEKTGAKIDISDDGVVKIASSDSKALRAAVNWIKSIVAEPELNAVYEGTVVKVVEFGAFVNFFGSRDGLVHISQISSSRVQRVGDVVKEGDKVWVKLLGFDGRGKIRLSMKAVDQKTGAPLEEEASFGDPFGD